MSVPEPLATDAEYQRLLGQISEVYQAGRVRAADLLHEGRP